MLQRCALRASDQAYGYAYYTTTVSSAPFSRHAKDITNMQRAVRRTLILDVLRSVLIQCKADHHENCSAAEAGHTRDMVVVELCTCECHVFGYVAQG